MTHISILNNLLLIIILQEYVNKETNNGTDIDLVYRNYSQKMLIIVMPLCSNAFASIKKMSKFYLRQIISLKQAVHSQSHGCLKAIQSRPTPIFILLSGYMLVSKSKPLS